jgi:hypothetical protein
LADQLLKGALEFTENQGTVLTVSLEFLKEAVS